MTGLNAPTDRVMAQCNCIDQMNAKLSAHNTKLVMAITLGGGPTRAIIRTEQVETGRGKKKAATLLASFCPFCGDEYAKDSQ